MRMEVRLKAGERHNVSMKVPDNTVYQDRIHHVETGGRRWAYMEMKTRQK